ncbi:hypothetical protein SNEBB_011347 [Seison nebaliae]|nr:hypothetical protein SNEBB_011347 [Seison nebaliae]
MIFASLNYQTKSVVDYAVRTPNYHLMLKVIDEGIKVADSCVDQCNLQFGADWTGLIVPDLDFLFFLSKMERTYNMILGACKINGLTTWLDKYRTPTFNRDTVCEMWTTNDPEDNPNIVIFNSQNTNHHRHHGTALKHATLSDLISRHYVYRGCSNIQVKKLEAKFKVSNSRRDLVANMVKEFSAIDYKLIYGYDNCFYDLKLDFPEGNATLIYRSFIPTDYA